MARSFSFIGSDAGGTGSAIMEISLSGGPVQTNLKIKLYNTSPTKLQNSTGSNSPCIVGFSYNISSEAGISNILDWDLVAKAVGTNVDNIVNIDLPDMGHYSSWDKYSLFDIFSGIPSTNPPSVWGAVQSGLYNPDVLIAANNLPLGFHPNIPNVEVHLFTMATFDILLTPYRSFPEDLLQPLLRATFTLLLFTLKMLAKTGKEALYWLEMNNT